MAESIQYDFKAQSRLHRDNKILGCYWVGISVKGALIELLPIQPGTISARST